MEYINKRLIRVALGKESADMVIKGGRLMNVFTESIYPADVAIAEGRIAAIGDVDYCIGDHTEIIDAAGKYLAPGLIDSHIHAEATKVTMTNLANTIVARGTTSIMTPLDQVCNVSGMQGVRWMLDEVKKTPLKIFNSGPSRLPYTTPASTVGHTFGTKEHAITQQWEEAVGIWEYLTDSIVDFDEQVLETAELTIHNRLLLHGHAYGTVGKALAAHVAAGMRDDHETTETDEAIEKISNGVYCLLRRGTHVDNIVNCLKAVTEDGMPTRRLALCTDDLDCTDIADYGLVDYLVRHVIDLGVSPITAIQMGTLNAAEAYRVDHLVGSIAPGRIADVLLVSDLQKFVVDAVIADGKLVARGGEMINPLPSPVYPDFLNNTMKLDKPITEDDLYLTVDKGAKSADVLVIHLPPEEALLSKYKDTTLQVEDGRVMPDPANDILYITVTDRHSGKGLTGKGLICGFGLKRGAIATSLSPDDDNIICIGASVGDMALAINHLVNIGGGQVVVDSGRVAADIRLPICGLAADVSVQKMAEMEQNLREACYALGTEMKRPFFKLIFLSITSIPEYAVTDKGLVATDTRTLVNPILGVH